MKIVYSVGYFFAIPVMLGVDLLWEWIQCAWMLVDEKRRRVE